MEIGQEGQGLADCSENQNAERLRVMESHPSTPLRAGSLAKDAKDGAPAAVAGLPAR